MIHPYKLKENKILTLQLSLIVSLTDLQVTFGENYHEKRKISQRLYTALPFSRTILKQNYEKALTSDFDTFVSLVIDGFIKWIFETDLKVTEELVKIKNKHVESFNDHYRSTFIRFYGEFPDPYPTVLSQLEQLKNKNSIDLLFINGGPNDIGILKTVSSNATFQGALKEIDEFASSRVAVLLKEARRLCPNALIVYTGYYPGLSPDSDIPMLGGEAVKFAVSPTLVFLSYYLGLGWLAELFIRSQQDRLKRQGLIFHKRILGKFREQIGIFNENRAVDTLPIIFSPSGFGSLNAMWARAELVSSTGIDPNKKVTINRKAICKKIAENYDLDYDDKLMCESAFVAHPNVRGANVYFKALKKRIDNQLNYSLRKHLETIDKDIMSIRELKDKYKFIPIRSIRNLTDVLWLDSILIDYTFSFTGEATQSFLPIPIRVLVDFGIPNYNTEAIRAVILNNKVKDNYVIDIRYETKVSDLKYVELRLDPYFETLTFSMQFSIRVNGYKFKKLTLDETSFLKIEKNQTNETEYLEYKEYI